MSQSLAVLKITKSAPSQIREKPLIKFGALAGQLAGTMGLSFGKQEGISTRFLVA